MVQRYAPRYVPPGWPPEVNPPGLQDWETTAAAWRLDLVPEYRQHAAVRRHPVILAFIARHVIAGAVQGARQGYRATRTELGDLVPPHAIDAALRAWRAEGERLAATACAVDLVERALRGETFRPRLLRSRSQSGDRPELVGDKQRDQVSELLSAQLHRAAEVVNECDAPLLGAVRVDHYLWNGVVLDVFGRHRVTASSSGPRLY